MKNLVIWPRSHCRGGKFLVLYERLIPGSGGGRRTWRSNQQQKRKQSKNC
jgi:hypothetical protein